MAENNQALIVGRVSGAPALSHQLQGEDFYKAILDVPRRSNILDRVPLIFGAYACDPALIIPGQAVSIDGQVRTYTRVSGQQRHLQVVLFGQEVKRIQQFSGEGRNQITLVGRIAKAPTFRKTPLGREICDLLITVQRSWNRSDYIPCIAWGAAAAYCARTRPGQGIKIFGRFQSREYVKRLSDTLEEKRTAYEISIIRVSTF